MNKVAISIADVIKKYPKSESGLKGISTQFLKDGLSVIIGTNGCGKSTLMHCIAGLTDFQKGKIEVALSDNDSFTLIGGKNNKVLINARKKIGIIFQQKALWPHLKVRDNIIHPLKNVKGIDTIEANNIAEEYLSRIGLDKNHFDKYPLQLSGGEQRKVAIARTLAVNPEILLIDELEANLDQSALKLALSVIGEDFIKNNKTVVMISHRIDLLKKYTPNIILLDQGELVVNEKKFHSLFNELSTNLESKEKITQEIEQAETQLDFPEKCLNIATEISKSTLTIANEGDLFIKLGKIFSELIMDLEGTSSEHLLLIVTKSGDENNPNFLIRSAEKTKNFILNGEKVSKLSGIVKTKGLEGQWIYDFMDDYNQKIKSKNSKLIIEMDTPKKSLIGLMFDKDAVGMTYSQNEDHSEKIAGAYNIHIPIQEENKALKEAYYQFSEHTNNVYLIAIKDENEILGVISVDTTSKDKWSNFVMGLLIIIARNLAIAIEHQFKNQTKKRTKNK